MTITLEPIDAAARGRSPRAALLVAAGLASIGAGAIHAAAIGMHADHRPTALTFTALTVVQIGWGLWACLRANRLVAVTGVVAGLAAVIGFALAKTVGIGVIGGLETPEPVQLVDGLAAGLALASAVLAGAAWFASTEVPTSTRPRIGVPFAMTAVGALTVIGLIGASSHVHTHGGAGDDHGHDATVAAGAHGDHDASHDNPSPASAVPAGMATEDPTQHQHAAAPVVPYDPTKPLDFGGIPGVTAEQQAAAENLVAVTLYKLPQWADYHYAEAHGFHSIGDGPTGTEHFVNYEYMNDDIVLDPDKPESLVYDTKRDGTKTLAAAMYMVKAGTPLSDVPKVGGALMQWHIHNNLCYTPQGVLGGLTDAQGKCAPGLILPVPAPMIHVWIRKHPCGPFAALEGIGGGVIPEGETRLCDTAHGSH